MVSGTMFAEKAKKKKKISKYNRKHMSVNTSRVFVSGINRRMDDWAPERGCLSLPLMIVLTGILDEPHIVGRG
jgi:hypothetical protein